MTEPSLVVSEAFGPTFQGEGPSTGKLCAFIRLGGCNLHCTWCDTPYTWDAQRFDLRNELNRRPVADLVAFVETLGVPLVVITGGEPLLHQRVGLQQLVAQLTTQRGLRIEIETNGTVMPQDGLLYNPAVSFNVSPKLSHAGDPEVARVRPDVLAEFAKLARGGRACFKFVARHPLELQDDLDEVAELVDVHQLSRVWVMPEGVTREQITAGTWRLADPVIERGWNLSTRLHVLAWGSERGR